MLTTVCTACGTAFRVTPEQLKLREGRVRCGKCETVFNALVTLDQREAGEATVSNAATFAASADMASAEPGLIGISGQAPAETGPVQGPILDANQPFVSEITEENAATSTSSDSADSEHGSGSQAPEAPLPPEPPLAPAPPFEWPNIDPREFPAPVIPEPVSVAPVAVPATVPVEPRAADPEAQTKADSATFDFGPKAPALRRSRWWTPFVVLFLFALLGQAAYYFRGAIAFMFPEAKPYISEICAELGCEVPLPRRAELISIETSDLQADPTNPGVIVLLATLRNRAAFPQTYPALELTLTNEREQPLARRVLQPGDYLVDKTEVFEGSSEKQIRLNIEAGSIKASGYRLYLFYP